MHKCEFCDTGSSHTIRYYHKYYKTCKRCYKYLSNLKDVKFYQKYNFILNHITFYSVWNSFRKPVRC